MNHLNNNYFNTADRLNYWTALPSLELFQLALYEKA